MVLAAAAAAGGREGWLNHLRAPCAAAPAVMSLQERRPAFLLLLLALKGPGGKPCLGVALGL